MQIYQYYPRDMRLDTPAIIRIARENGAVSVAEPLNLGARVRELRKERGWTLEQAAGHAGLGWPARPCPKLKMAKCPPPMRH